MQFGRVSGPRLATVIRIKMSSGEIFGVFDEHVKVAILIEHAGVGQFELMSARPRRRFSSTKRA